MILSQLTKHFSIHTLIALFLTLQISACSSENPAETVSNNTPSDTSKTTDNPDNTTRADINLSWTAPSERENNEPISLSEIAGYKVYFGTQQRNYSSSVDINDGSADGHTFSGFSAGTYYFALTTYDTAGRESQYSTEIKIIV